jgi:hypothetical protein
VTHQFSSVVRADYCATARRYLYALLLSGGAQSVLADHPTVAFGSEATGPINTIAATPMPVGKWAIGLRNEFIQRDALADDRLAGFAAQGIEGVHSVDTINSASLAVAYGLSDALTLSVRLPWVARAEIREGELEDGEAEAHNHGDASGIGDLVALGNWRALHSDDFDAALQLGFKAPTGETEEVDGAERLESEFQPGSGSWDLLVGGALSRMLGRWSVHSNILFNLFSEGAQNTAIGDALFYNLAAVYVLNGDQDHHGHDDAAAHKHWRFDAVLEINGETRWKNKIAGVDEDNSGGTVIYLSPGLRASFGRMGGFISAGLPVLDDPNGVQTDIDFRLVGGMSFLF